MTHIKNMIEYAKSDPVDFIGSFAVAIILVFGFGFIMPL